MFKHLTIVIVFFVIITTSCELNPGQAIITPTPPTSETIQPTSSTPSGTLEPTIKPSSSPTMLRPPIDVYLSIEELANDDIHTILPEFPIGDQVFEGIPFSIPQGKNKASTRCSGSFSKWPTEFYIPLSDPLKAETLYLLINAGVTVGYRDKQIGEIELSFDDGDIFSYALVLGENIREWRIQARGTIAMASSSDLVEAYRGLSKYQDTGVLDMLTLNFPKLYREKSLKGITIRDVSQDLWGTSNPCLFFVAITIRLHS